MLEEAQMTDLKRRRMGLQREVLELTGRLRMLNERNSLLLEEKIAPKTVTKSDAPILNIVMDWETCYLVTCLKGLQSDIEKMKTEMASQREEEISEEMKELMDQIEVAKRKHSELKQNYLSLKEELDRAKADIKIEKEEIRRYLRANMLIER